MTLRIAHITDLHLTRGRRLADQAGVLDHIVRHAIAAGVQLTLITGDVYGRTVPHESKTQERGVFYPFVAKLAQLGPVVVIPGNHDYPGDLDTLAELGGGFGWPVIVQTRPKVLRLKTPGADVHVYALPWLTKAILLQGEARPRTPEQVRQVASAKLDQLLQVWSSRVSRTRQKDPDVVHVFASHCMTHGARTSGGEVLTGHEIEVSRPAIEAMGVDYGALGHIHFRQEVAPRVWYAGSPMRNDHSETDDKGWHLVDIIGEPTVVPVPAGAASVEFVGGVGDVNARIAFMRTPCRDFVTLDWRWAADDDDGSPCWVTAPPDGYLDTVSGAEVRARLTVPQQWVAGCPWDQVVQGLRDAGAHYIDAQRVIEPVLRVRAPAVAKAETPAEKLDAYWKTLGTPPDPADAESARALFADLQSMGDEAIRDETTQMLVGAA